MDENAFIFNSYLDLYQMFRLLFGVHWIISWKIKAICVLDAFLAYWLDHVTKIAQASSMVRNITGRIKPN